MNSLEQQVGGDHYRKHGALQPWCILREYLSPEELRGYHKGTAIVYLLRERDKGGDEDIRKAAHVLQHLVEMTEPPITSDVVDEDLQKMLYPVLQRQVHNPNNVADPGEGFRFAYVDEKRSACSHCWKHSGWEELENANDMPLHPGFTYRVKL